MTPVFAVIALWVFWALSWTVAAVWANRTEKRAPLAGQVRYRIFMIAGAVLMFQPAHGYEGPLRLWHPGWDGAWGCVGLIALGIAWAWWARIHLGRLWSGHITRKEDHRLIDTGPYALTRHPIYSGLLLSLLATMLVKGTVWAVAGFALLLIGLVMKSRMEEAWLSQELGQELYGDYRRRVPMLVPFIGARG